LQAQGCVPLKKAHVLVVGTHTKASSDNTGCFARKTVIVQKKMLAWVDLAITVLSLASNKRGNLTTERLILCYKAYFL
jgi:hypothetical protein